MVAALYWPVVRKEPLPVPHRRRDLGLEAKIAALALAFFGQPVSFWLSLRSVTPFFWVTLKKPSQNSPVSAGLPGCGIDVSSTGPLVASTSELSGMPLLMSSGTNLFVPGSLTSNVPELGATTTLWFGTGVGAGVGVGVGVGVGPGCGVATVNEREVSVLLPAESVARTKNV